MRDNHFARTVMERCDILGSFSEESGRLTRRFATPPMKQVNETVAAWMRAAGMTVHVDAIGNLIGRYEAAEPGARTLLLGSHLDTVPNAGKYDGPLGVMVALACIERLHMCGKRLPFAIEVLGFADEEGLRYRCAYLGSSVVAGTFPQQLLELEDSDGITMAEAIRDFGGDPAALEASKRGRDDLLGYCEVHIEQGPVLEAHDVPVGVVSAIAGQSRLAASFTGEAGHAGTVPMILRRDALCAAAEFTLLVESYARSIPGLVATVGQLAVEPGASNVIPEEVMVSVDVRHQDDTIRERACQWFRHQVQRIAQERHLTADWQVRQERCTVSCAPTLQDMLALAIEEQGYPLHVLPSGAGHDGVMLSVITEIALLFVRCYKGISHHPTESVIEDDVAVAIEVLERFLLFLAEEEGGISVAGNVCFNPRRGDKEHWFQEPSQRESVHTKF